MDDDLLVSAVVAYWLKYYTAKDGCVLCGNSGVVDTIGVRTATGLRVGKLTYCICPNGQDLRRAAAPLDSITTGYDYPR